MKNANSSIISIVNFTELLGDEGFLLTTILNSAGWHMTESSKALKLYFSVEQNTILALLKRFNHASKTS